MPFALCSTGEDGGVEVARGDGVGDGGSGLAEGDGGGAPKRVLSNVNLGDPGGGSGECGEERGEGSMGVLMHPLSALLVLSTGVSGISATRLLLMVTVVNIDAEGSATATCGGATFSTAVIFVGSLWEAEFRRGPWGVIVFPFRFRVTPLVTPRTGTGVAKTSEDAEDAEAAADDMNTRRGGWKKKLCT